MTKVSRRGGFSDRNGIKPENRMIQLKEFDQRTRTQLQNMISYLYNCVYNQDLYFAKDDIQAFFRFVVGTVYSQAVDVRKLLDDSIVFDMINNTLLHDDYDDLLTLIEAIVQYWDDYLKETRGLEYYDEQCDMYTTSSLFEVVNSYFKREYIGYRFINRIIEPISDSLEVKTIEEAINSKNKGVYGHLAKANRYLSDRVTPDYENSIKESISAVEAICQIITGIHGKEATLGNTLKKLEESGITIHKGLKSAFNTLYGYTSDANGIRHAGDIGGPSSTFDEAKFMLVVCCAFVNYLTALNAD